MIIKITYDSPTGRKNKLVELSDPPTHTELVELAAQLVGRSPLIEWEDIDGDLIVIDSPADLALYVREGPVPRRLFVSPSETPSPPPETPSPPPSLDPWPPRETKSPSPPPLNLAAKVYVPRDPLPSGPTAPWAARTPFSPLPSNPNPQGNVRTVAIPKLNARFVKHTTCDDESSTYGPNTPFFKTWRFRNDGGLRWPTKIALLFVSKLTGDQIGGPEELEVTFERQIDINEERDISVPLVAPSKPGEYTGFWKLADEAGKKFGQRVRVRIHVSDPVPDSALPERSRQILRELVEGGYRHADSTIRYLLSKAKPGEDTCDAIETQLGRLGVRMSLND